MRRLLLALPFLLAACATNPVTGKRELAFVSESQEVQLGLDNAKSVVASMGLYDDSKWQVYVDSLGRRMALASERPQLPWKYSVIEDPAVNAFALPGGQVFVTRGILTYMNSEAELATVIGHETGHVTARHSVQQLSRQQLAQVGLAVGSVLSPKVAELSGLAGQGLGILFLKYSRDDESQADALGFRYAYNAGWDVREMKNMFVTLERVGAGAGRVPEWQSTHPAPENRLAKTQFRLDSLGKDLTAYRVNRDEFLRRLDGMPFGEDPRKGYFIGPQFVQPELAIHFAFPEGWKTANSNDAVKAQDPQGAALASLTISQAAPDQALTALAQQQGVTVQPITGALVPGLVSRSAYVRVTSDQQANDGIITFVQLDGRTYQLLGVTGSGQLPTYEAAFRAWTRSFGKETDRTRLAVQPAKLQIVTASRAMSVEQFNAENPSSTPFNTWLIVNGFQEGQQLKRGQLLKRIVGGGVPK
jgi:predicted Zn-dependent protease